MHAKLLILKMKMVLSAKELIEKRPTATIISTRVQPSLLRFFEGSLINIVLNSVLSDERAHSASTRKIPAAGPGQTDDQLAHVAAIGRIKWNIRYPNRTVVGNALRAGCGLGVINVFEDSGNETGGEHLIPVVESNRFEFFQDNLSCTLVLASQLHDIKAVGKTADESSRQYWRNQ